MDQTVDAPHGSRGPRTVSRRRALLLAATPVAEPFARAAAGEPRAGDAPPASPLASPLGVEDRTFLALDRFRQGFHCSQSVLAAYADEDALGEDAALRMGAALAGGSTVGGECGAIAAAYLVLGLRHGSPAPAFGDTERERELFDRIRALVAGFRQRHGAITCRELLGIDVFTPEGLAEGRRRGLFARRCPGFIRDVIRAIESR